MHRQITRTNERKNDTYPDFLSAAQNCLWQPPDRAYPLVQRVPMRFCRVRRPDTRSEISLSNLIITFNMFTIIGFMLTGITLGYLFRNIAWLQKTEKSISLTIILLLFLLGTSVGSNQLIVNNLATFGGQAAILALSATCGSILASWMVLRFFFRKGGEQ